MNMTVATMEIFGVRLIANYFHDTGTGYAIWSTPDPRKAQRVARYWRTIPWASNVEIESRAAFTFDDGTPMPASHTVIVTLGSLPGAFNEHTKESE